MYTQVNFAYTDSRGFSSTPSSSSLPSMIATPDSRGFSPSTMGQPQLQAPLYGQGVSYIKPDQVQQFNRQRQQERNRLHYYYQNSIYPISGYEYYPVYQNTGLYGGQGYPSGFWVSTTNGSVPNYAIVYENTNPPSYYCRAYYRGQLYYGTLVANDACYLKDQTVTIRMTTYSVLVVQ
jgi:hypothetical protein